MAAALERRSLGAEFRDHEEKLRALQSELQQHKLEEEIARNRGEIYASIIHDINGPLTIISGLIQIITQRIGAENRIEGEDLETVRDRLKRITRQVTNCVEISRRYLSFLRQHPREDERRLDQSNPGRLAGTAAGASGNQPQPIAHPTGA